MGTKDPIELLRECLKYEHALDLLRIELGIELKSGWHYACLERLADEIETKYMRLPVDADGVTWHIGDEIHRTKREERPNIVTGICFYDNGNHALHVRESDCTAWVPIAHEYRHAKPDTVESVLEEFAVKYEQVNNASLPKVGFENEIIGEEELSDVIAEYSERIRKAVHDEN